MTIIAWSCIGLFCTAWLEECSKHVSIPSEPTSRLHFHHNSDWDRKSKTGSLTPQALWFLTPKRLDPSQIPSWAFFKVFSRSFSGPLKVPGSLREAPLGSDLAAALCHSFNNIRCTANLWRGGLWLSSKIPIVSHFNRVGLDNWFQNISTSWLKQKTAQKSDCCRNAQTSCDILTNSLRIIVSEIILLLE